MQKDIMISSRYIGERYIGQCAKCGTVQLKRRMATFSMRRDAYHPLKTLCHICQDCLPKLLDELGVAEP